MSDKLLEHSETIAEIRTDIKWLVADSKRRNGIMESHVNESDDFRMQVTRNTVWRHALKVGNCGAFVCIGYLWWYLFHIISR